MCIRDRATCAISCASFMDGMVVLEDVPLFKNERGGFMFRVDDHVKQFERSDVYKRQGVLREEKRKRKGFLNRLFGD